MNAFSSRSNGSECWNPAHAATLFAHAIPDAGQSSERFH
jgi:hypothetical protein